MRIHFSKNSTNSYGGGLNEPFCHFGRIISDKFQAEDIIFPYEEIEICLALPRSKNDNEQSKKWFQKLPHYYRGKTMLRITLPIEKKEEKLIDVLKVIDQAFEIIIAKKKKDDEYDPQKIKASLSQLKKELQETDLHQLNDQYEQLLKQEIIQRSIQERLQREQSNHEKKKLIYDIRLMYYLPNIDKLYFAPYDYEFCEIILEKLREKKFRLPNYTHLYVMVSDTFENALSHTISVINWAIYGIAVFENFADYPSKQDIEKQRIVFDLIKQGINDIAKIDKLDIKVLNEVFAEVEQEIFD